MNHKVFQQAEREFFLLKGQLATNRLTRAQFDAALQKLNVRDEYGRAWRVDPESGAWLIQQQDAWVPADPATHPAPLTAQPKTSPRSNNLVPLLALGALVLLCVCGIGAYALLNATGIITTQVNLFGTATPTQSIVNVTATPTFVALNSPTVSAATEPPLVTFEPTGAIPQTPTALATNTGAGTPTPEIPKAFISFDADFFADECPLFEGSNETRTYACELGEYSMLHHVPTTRYTFYDAEYADAVIDATGYFTTGTGKYEYGVVFRADADGKQYYVFTVTNDGRYNVALYKDEKYTDLIPYTASPLVKTGPTDFNFFTVVMRGAKFDFYLNDGFVGSVTDSTIASGYVGLFFYNAEANTGVGFDQFTISTFTPPPPTATPDVNATVTPDTNIIATATTTTNVPTAIIKPGVYVNSLRFTPRAPKRGEPVTFFATFVNSTGRAQNYKWLVEIWEQDANKRNPYGQADAQQPQIPSGTNERATGDSWKVAGGGPCIPFRARVVYEDDQNRRIAFKRTNGADLWVNFQVCP